jgi:hypothetical protein
MCDYSLMSLPNRLAVCGDELVVHRFELGAMGLASASDVCRTKENNVTPEQGFWAGLKRWLFPPIPQQCTAVCIAPGAKLLIRDLPVPLQKQLKLESSEQEVVFTQIGMAGFRDAIRFPNGTEVLLQRLTEGQRVVVLALASDEEDVREVLAKDVRRAIYANTRS